VFLQAKYLQGYTEISIRNSKNSIQGRIIRDIKNTVKNLTGFVIIDSNVDTVIIKDLLDPMELPIKKALGRTSTLSKLMVKNTYKVFDELNDELARDIIYWNEEVQKFYMLIYRQIRRASNNPRLAKIIGVEDNLYPLYVYTISRYLKDISGHISEIMTLYLEMNNKRKKTSRKLWGSMKLNGDILITEYENLMKAVITKNDKIANKSIPLFRELRQRILTTKKVHIDTNQNHQETIQILSRMESAIKLVEQMAMETALNA